MGFFSWDCRECGHPLLSFYVINDVNYWMNEVVSVLKDGRTIHGRYDGYGRIDDLCLVNNGGGLNACVYHKACWEKAGKPTEYVDSKRSEDQGYFYGDPAHDMPHPNPIAPCTHCGSTELDDVDPNSLFCGNCGNTAISEETG